MAFTVGTDAATTRTNLGLGDFATLDVGGSSGQALVSDGAGGISWATISGVSGSDYGDIGSYTVGVYVTSSVTRGSTTSGSNVQVVQFSTSINPFNQYENPYASSSVISSGLTGTWRCMQSTSSRSGISDGNTVTVYPSTLWVRIS